MLGDSKGIKWGKEGMVQLAGTKKIKSNKQITSPSSHCHRGNTGHPTCKHIPPGCTTPSYAISYWTITSLLKHVYNLVLG